jgi:mersacidin/lichenicidin family type 2 lantibiotic
MVNRNIIRAWKDPAYRNSLSNAQREALPANPAGSVELSDADLGKVTGGRVVLPTWYNFCSFYCSIRGCITDALTCTCKIF